jgi:hypothetical protein
MHFFIDHLELTAQAAAQGYGPDATQPTTLFNVTSRFQLANEAKAFACQESMMIVQQSAVDATLVNIVLKPNPALTIPLAVRYYVYRGILKSSLINGNQLTAQAPTNNELIKRIWAAAPQDTGAGTLGFDDNTFNGTDGIGEIFNGSHPGVKPILVTEGEWIGTYNCDYMMGFEVITGNNRFLVDLNYVRAEQYQINVTNLAAGFATRIKREEVLYFIDPAAFFGMHYSKGVNYSVYSGTTKTTKSTIEKTNNVSVNKTYSLLLSSFSTRNRVYLDIRSEKGYSYNFYGNYGDAANDHDVKIGQGAAATVSQNYETSQWPIFFVAAAQTTATSKNKVRVALRIDDNTKPVVYIEDSQLKEQSDKDRSNHFSGTEIVPGTPPDWSKNLSFVFPNTGTGASKDNVACYIRIYYFRQQHNAASPLRNEKYYDSAFCSVDLPRLGDAGFTSPHLKSANPNFVREALQTDGTGNFAYTAVNGAYWDDQRILFYSTLESGVVGQDSEKFYVNTYTRRLNSIENKTFRAALRRDINILCRRYHVAGNEIRIPAINSYQPAGPIAENRPAGPLTQKENVLLLGLSIAELGAIKSATGLATSHERYIFLDAGTSNRLTDDDGVRYWVYTVRLQGLDANGAPAIITPQSGSPILVYSRDNNFFSSVAFSANEDVSPEAASPGTTNRIEYHVYHDGYVKINDNIDLSLVHDAQDIFFIYHAAAGGPIEICHLDVLQKDKMERGVLRGDSPVLQPGYVTQINDYTLYNVNARKSYADADGNVLTIGTYTNENTNITYPNYQVSYRKLLKKTFLVYFDVALVSRAAAPRIDIVYSGTRRRYAKPEVAAALIGAAVDIGASASPQIESHGFSFDDCTCFPSQTHVNGEAVDTAYKHVLNADQAIIDAAAKFGFGTRLKGTNAYCSGLTGAQPDGGHNRHLHSGKVALNNRNLNE